MVYKIRRYVMIGVSVLLLLAFSGFIVSFIVKRQDKPTNNKGKYYTVTFDAGEYGVKSIVTQKIAIGSMPVLFKPECAVKSPCISWNPSWDKETQLDENETLPVPLQTELDDYAFVGWYYEGAKITEDNVYAFNKDITLVAKWRSLWIGNY